MANKLLDLFDENTVKEKDLVSSSPKTLEQMTASGSADPLALQSKIDVLNRVVPKVDYSDFSKFVFFNSALDYFNISGERMLNEWPYDGTYADQLGFVSQSDSYQNYLIEAWPSWKGGAVFKTGSYVTVNDVSFESGSSRVGALSPNTGSVTVEFHMYIEQFPASPERFYVVRDLSGSSVLYSISVTSGNLSYSFGDSVNGFASITTGSWYMSLVFDQQTSQVKFYAKPPQQNGWFDQFSLEPVMPLSASRVMSPSPWTLTGSSMFVVGGASANNGWSGIHLSELRIWNYAKSDHELFANYNTRVYKQEGLQLYWRFAEGMSGSFVRDYSGHKMHGTIKGIDPTSFWTGSFKDTDNFIMSPQDWGEFNLNFQDLDLQSFIQRNQDAALIHDKSNSNIMTNLVPFMYLYLEDENNTQVLKNLLFLLGRQFDELKVKIDQITKILLPSYTGVDETPDALLADVLKFWGWDTKANFLSHDAFRYFFGYDVLMPSGSVSGAGTPQAIINNQASYDNQKLDVTLQRIKNEFWHRTLQELIYIYKKKGTKESVDALLRVYGLDDKIVKLKEFGLRPDVGIQTSRINSSKSAWVRVFNSNATAVSSSGFPIANSGSTAVNMHVRFAGICPYRTWTMFISYPLNEVVYYDSYIWRSKVAGGNVNVQPGTDDGHWERLAPFMSPTVTDGTVYSIYDSTSHVESLTFSRALNSTTGSLSYAGYSASDLPIFDGRWYSVSTQRNGSAVEINVDHLDEDTVDWSYRSGQQASVVTLVGDLNFRVGSSSAGPSEFMAMNAQVWNLYERETDLIDHCLNPFSFGVETPDRAERLELNWMFDKDIDEVQEVVFDQSVNHNHGLPQTDPYSRQSFDYNFIAPPDYGWTEEKIRYTNNVRPDAGGSWVDSTVVSLEFNLVDALNEDISYMISSMDNWNNLIGSAANRHRDDYPSLTRFRSQYFNRLQNRINFRAFADFLDFFDRSFVELIRKLIPARSNFKGAEFVVENHMLERPKVQYTYRRQSPQLVPEGVIWISGPGESRGDLSYPRSSAGLQSLIVDPKNSVIYENPSFSTWNSYTINGSFDGNLSQSWGQYLADPYGPQETDPSFQSDFFEFTANGFDLRIASRLQGFNLLPLAPNSEFVASECDTRMWLYEYGSTTPIAVNDDAEYAMLGASPTPTNYLYGYSDFWSYLDPFKEGLLTAGNRYVIELSTYFPFNAPEFNQFSFTLQLYSKGPDTLNFKRITSPFPPPTI